jgi:heterotetrameric sarcosine oxidase gamma subunit
MVDRVQLLTLPPTRRLIIQGDPATIGLAEPSPHSAIAIGDQWLLWLGPDEFLLLDAADTVPSTSCIIDVSHRDMGVAVSGLRAAWAINAFCALDLHVTAFPVGMCTRTVFGKVGILLWRTAAEAFRIEVARSFAPYVLACLEEARREFLA